jgi:hypothetical protein
VPLSSVARAVFVGSLFYLLALNSVKMRWTRQQRWKWLIKNENAQSEHQASHS